MSRLKCAGTQLSTAPMTVLPPPVRKTARQRYPSGWDDQSLQFRIKNPRCLGCRAVGLVTPTDVTDHVRPHHGEDRLMWDRSNWQPACHWHHNRVKQALERKYERGSIGARDLRLDSLEAVALTRRLMQRGKGPGR